MDNLIILFMILKRLIIEGVVTTEDSAPVRKLSSFFPAMKQTKLWQPIQYSPVILIQLWALQRTLRHLDPLPPHNPANSRPRRESEDPDHALHMEVSDPHLPAAK